MKTSTSIFFLEAKPKTLVVHQSFEAEKPKIIENVFQQPKTETTFKQRPNEIEKRQKETERPNIRNDESKPSPRGNHIKIIFVLQKT